MSLREAAERNMPKTGRPSKIAALRERLKPAQQVELDEVLADLSLTDVAVARAISDEYGVVLGATTIRTWRLTNRLR